jgi:hypothetical protein
MLFCAGKLKKNEALHGTRSGSLSPRAKATILSSAVAPGNKDVTRSATGQVLEQSCLPVSAQARLRRQRH